MAPLFDATSNTDSTQSVALPRLYQFDLPYIKQTGRPFPEQTAGSTLQQVLDIAAGRGEWAIAAAQATPSLQIVGIDADDEQAEQARTEARTRGIEHVTFRTMNPFERLEVGDSTFDLVNVRYIIGLLLATAWPGMLQECVRVVRAGGIVRLTETDMPITNSPAVEQLSGWIARAYMLTQRSFSPSGRLLSVTGMLKRFLQEAGCQDVQQAVWNLNFSAGMPAYAEVSQALAQTYRVLLPFLVMAGVAMQEEIEQTYQRMLVEMQQERFTANVFSLSVWGTKPPHRS
jgi:ubiquinone/menaquinone biosynthesis C-methylase UbiE